MPVAKKSVVCTTSDELANFLSLYEQHAGSDGSSTSSMTSSVDGDPVVE